MKYSKFTFDAAWMVSIQALSEDTKEELLKNVTYSPSNRQRKRKE